MCTSQGARTAPVTDRPSGTSTSRPMTPPICRTTVSNAGPNSPATPAPTSIAAWDSAGRLTIRRSVRTSSRKRGRLPASRASVPPGWERSTAAADRRPSWLTIRPSGGRGTASAAITIHTPAHPTMAAATRRTVVVTPRPPSGIGQDGETVTKLQPWRAGRRSQPGSGPAPPGRWRCRTPRGSSNGRTGTARRAART